MATPGVGEDIEGICGRCGQTWHVVMAKVGDRIAKVVCKRCGTHHSYRGATADVAEGAARGNGDARRAMARRRSRRAAATPPPVVPTFDPSKPPRAYAGKEAFASGERVSHPTFGTGIVTGSPGPGKVEIAFPAGARVLACAKVISTLERPVAVSVPVADRPPSK